MPIAKCQVLTVLPCIVFVFVLTCAHVALAFSTPFRMPFRIFIHSFDVVNQMKTALKPRLASINQAAELAALVEKEERRSAEVTSAVDKTEVQVIAALNDNATVFKRLLVHNSTALLRLLDRCLDAEDLKPLRSEDRDLLRIERGHGLEQDSPELAQVLDEIESQMGEHGAITLKERPLDEFQAKIRGDLLRAGGGVEATGGFFDVDAQVELKVQLSSRHGVPKYSEGTIVTVHAANTVSSIPKKYSGLKDRATSFEVVQHQPEQGVVVVQVANANANATQTQTQQAAVSPSQKVASVGPFTVPVQLVCGPDDLFVPGVVKAKGKVAMPPTSPSAATSARNTPLNPSITVCYDVEFEKPHASLRRLRRKERRIGRPGELVPPGGIANANGIDGDSNGGGGEEGGGARIREELRPRARREREWSGLDMTPLVLPDDAIVLLEQAQKEEEEARAKAEEEAALAKAKAEEEAANNANARASGSRKGKKPGKGLCLCESVCVSFMDVMYVVSWSSWMSCMGVCICLSWM